MKLYATVTSERASKGQGGNEYVDVFINDINGEMLAKLRVYLDRDGIGDVIHAAVDFREDVYVNGLHWLDAELTGRNYTKGEKEKGKSCEHGQQFYCGHGCFRKGEQEKGKHMCAYGKKYEPHAADFKNDYGRWVCEKHA